MCEVSAGRLAQSFTGASDGRGGLDEVSICSCLLHNHAAASTNAGHESCCGCATWSGVTIMLQVPLRVLLLLEALNSWPSTGAWSLLRRRDESGFRTLLGPRMHNISYAFAARRVKCPCANERTWWSLCS